MRQFDVDDRLDPVLVHEYAGIQLGINCGRPRLEFERVVEALAVEHLEAAFVNLHRRLLKFELEWVLFAPRQHSLLYLELHVVLELGGANHLEQVSLACLHLPLICHDPVTGGHIFVIMLMRQLEVHILHVCMRDCRSFFAIVD